MYWLWGLTLWLAAIIGVLLGWAARVRVAEENAYLDNASLEHLEALQVARDEADRIEEMNRPEKQ